MGDPTPQRGKVVAYTQESHPRTQASTHIKIMKTKEAGKEITSALCGQYKNVHMLVASAWTDCVIGYYCVITTTEGELDWDTCGEGVEAAEKER